MAKYRTYYCRYCKQERLFRKPRVHHLQNLALTIVTAGLYLIPWAAMILRRMNSPWRCRTCHHSHRPLEKVPAAEPNRELAGVTTG